MQLKRYTTEELIPILSDLFYDYMSSEKGGATNAETTYLDYKTKISEYKDRIKLYEEAINDNSIEKEATDSLNKQLAYLEQGLKYLESTNMQFQKELYKKTGTTDFCRSFVRIPLDKKINSYYDDFSVDIVFYDDVCTPLGKYKKYEKLTTKEDRVKFLKDNTEITHIGLVYAPQKQVRAIISVMGKLNFSDPRIQESGITLLDQKFSNFENLTLKDTTEINNNDLKQFIQTKIDLDKENMELLASVNIRGDIYKILKPQGSKDKTIYIRYVCRSTGRVYYNPLNLRNLEISKEYIKDDYESYAKAWWNLNTLGSEVNGKPVIRC